MIHVFEIRSEYGSFHFNFKEIKLHEILWNCFARSPQNEVTHLVDLVLREINLGNHFKLLRSEVTLVKIY